MMDDIATNYESANPSSTSIRAFSPKFDVVEVKDAYHLHGELPGLDQKDVSIEFADPHTLVIKGHVEHRYERSEPADEGHKETTDASHKVTAEDESAEKSKESKETAVTTTDGDKKDVARAGHHKTKYWVSERSVGEFHRSFSFPTSVDQDGVKATLKQGVLSITVPKLSATKGTVARGTNSGIGSGIYSVDSQGESAEPRVEELLAQFRKEGMIEKVWKHVEDEFMRITGLEAA